MTYCEPPRCDTETGCLLRSARGQRTDSSVLWLVMGCRWWLLMVRDRNTDPGRVTSVPCTSVSFSVNGEHSGTHLGGLLWRWNELIRIRCLEKHLCVKCFLNISADSMMGSVVVCTRLSLDSISVSSRVLIHVVCSISDTWALEMKITENKNLIVFYFWPYKGKRFKFWTYGNSVSENFYLRFKTVS